MPVLSTLRIFLTQATISWEDGFVGLSRLMTLYFKYSNNGLFKGDVDDGIGV